GCLNVVCRAARKWRGQRGIHTTVAPATTSDGDGGTDGFPMGTRFQLDPSLNLDKLGLAAREEMVARALQVYGMYIVDSSAGVVCYAANASFYRSDPYPKSWSD